LPARPVRTPPAELVIPAPAAADQGGAGEALPFAPLVPNAVTIEAMKVAWRGGHPRFTRVEDLLDALHAND